MGLIQHIRLANSVVSILVPVYKVPEKYLIKCIESCISPTLPDIEMIIEDDGSHCVAMRKAEATLTVLHARNNQKKTTGQEISPLGRCMR